MSIFNFLHRNASGKGRNSKKPLDYRRFSLESLEARCLLSVNPGFTGDAPAQTAEEAPVDVCVVITTDIPTKTEVDQIPESISVVNAGENVYVSVYVRGDASLEEYDLDFLGVSHGYCSLHYDPTGFKPDTYIPSANFPDDTILDKQYDFSGENYISLFGGMSFPDEDKGIGEWALVGTYSFTATTAGDYGFYTGLPIEAGVENPLNVFVTTNDYLLVDEGIDPYVNDYYNGVDNPVVVTVVGTVEAAVDTRISITTEVPATEAAEVPASVTEVNTGDTVYVSVYVKSTDVDWGVIGGYCTLYFDGTGFTAGDYTESAVYSNDNRVFENEEGSYVSYFGGLAFIDDYAKDEWVLAGTYSFTAKAEGDYTFRNDKPVSEQGEVLEEQTFMRADYFITDDYSNSYDNVTLKVTGAAPLPDIEGVSVKGYTGQYDGAEHSITIVDPQAATDTILYSLDRENYSPDLPTFVFGDATVYVKVSREGYNDWDGSADVSITAAQLTVDGTTVADKVYDGTTNAEITLGQVTGIAAGDEGSVTVTADGEFESADAGDYQVAVTYTISGEKAQYYIAPAAEEIAASIAQATITVENFTVKDKVYDGTTTAVINRGDVSGIVDGDDVTVNADGAFESADAGNYDVQITYTLAGAKAGNYVLAETTTTDAAKIYQKTITVTGTTVDSKVYDGTTVAIVNKGAVSGVISADEGKVDVTADGAFPSADAGDYQVAVTYTISGEKAQNYKTPAAEEIAASITPARITGVTVIDTEKVYDGKPCSVLVAGLQEGDVVTYSRDGINYSETVPTFTDADTYTVYVKVDRGSNYYPFTESGKVVIKQAKITDVTVDGWEGDYDGEAHSITVTDPQAATDTILYSTDGVDYSETNPSFTDTGSHTVYVKVDRGDNYEVWTTSAEVKIIGEGPDLVTVALEAFDNDIVDEAGNRTEKIDTLTIDGGTLTTGQSVYVKVTFENIGDGAVENEYFWNAIRLKNADTNEYILADAAGSWLERLSEGGQQSGETGDFDFIITPLEIGNYTLEIQLNNREEVYESDYTNDYTAVNFTVVAEEVKKPDLVYDSISAVDKFLDKDGHTITLNIDGGEIWTSSTPVITVYYRNAAEDPDAVVPNKYFYSLVRVKNKDTGEYIDFGAGKDGTYYERISPSSEMAPGEIKSFSFVLPCYHMEEVDGEVQRKAGLTPGEYEIEITINDRYGSKDAQGNLVVDDKGNPLPAKYWVDESNYDDLNKASVSFTVVPDPAGPEVDMAIVSVEAVKYPTTDDKLDIGGGTGGRTITQDDITEVTVTFKNEGKEELDADYLAKHKYFYSTVRVAKLKEGHPDVDELGENLDEWVEKWVVFDPKAADPTTYERVCRTVNVDGESTFKFRIRQLTEKDGYGNGDYVLRVNLNSRAEGQDNHLNESDRADNTQDYFFTVGNKVEKYPDLRVVQVSAVDYYSRGSEKLRFNENGGVISEANLANVTVYIDNVGAAAVKEKYINSRVLVRKAGMDPDNPESWVLRDDGSWYNRVSNGDLKVTGTTKFSFLIPKLEAGNYELEIQVNYKDGNGNYINEGDNSSENNNLKVEFTVEKAPTAAADLTEYFSDDSFVDDLFMEF